MISGMGYQINAHSMGVRLWLTRPRQKMVIISTNLWYYRFLTGVLHPMWEELAMVDDQRFLVMPSRRFCEEGELRDFGDIWSDASDKYGNWRVAMRGKASYDAEVEHQDLIGPEIY
ncbi:hypothetical protein K439DRAFT_1626301 [Ramaria rubella]|nr:hypothetical protein K439DRAFT_1626301 [Ramaria rubella]